MQAQARISPQGEPIARWRSRASPGPWCSSEKAFDVRSSRMPAEVEVLGSLEDRSGVIVDDTLSGSAAVQALSRPSAATSSANTSRATRS